MRATPRLFAVLSALACLAVVGGVLAWATINPPALPRAAASAQRTVPIRSSSLVCPQVGGAGTNGAARVAYADASGTPIAGTDAVTTQPLDALSQPAPLDVQPGHAWVVDAPKTAAPMRIDVSGELTDSFAAMQFSRDVVGSGAVQLATAMCEPPITDAWFAGLSSHVGAHAMLLLSNVDDVPALVDIGLYDDTNPKNPQARRGIRVAGQTQVQVPVDALDPGVDNLVVHIAVTAGRVVPAVRYTLADGEIPLGTAWVPRTAAPARTQTLPGLLAGDGGRRLVLANPGDVDATASVEVSTPDGSFTPDGFDQVDVPAGQVTVVDLQPALRQQEGAVRVSADQPIVAAAESALPQGKLGTSDIGFTAAVPALTGTSVVPGGETQPGRHTLLVLSAPDGDAQVTLTVLPTTAGSGASTSSVDIAAGTTKQIDLASLTKDPAPGVAITASGGPVYAAWALQEAGKTGDGLAEVPVRTPARTLVVRPAHADLTAGLS